MLLVLNAGSSSVKTTLYRTGDWQVLANALAERIGTDGARITWSQPDRGTELIPGADQAAAINILIDRLGEIADLQELQAVGHRVVHGGEHFQAATLITPDVLAALQPLVRLAPLHNPANLAGIEVALARLPSVPQVACFDTAFFASLPPEAYRYAVPERWYRDHGVRRYGFHGQSHKYVALRTAELLGKPYESLRLITLHLGSGASAAAIRHGRPIMTSMGFSTLPGLVMGTRPGDFDTGALFHLVREGEPLDVLEKELYRESGLRALSGGFNDHRDLQARADAGDEASRLALDVEHGRLLSIVGGLWALLGGLDALVFTAGIGEHDARTRARLVESLACFGLRLDAWANDALRGEGAIHAPGSAAPVWVVPTGEERMIARETLEVLGAG